MAPLNAVIARCNKFVETGNVYTGLNNTDAPDNVYQVFVHDNPEPIGIMLFKFANGLRWNDTGIDRTLGPGERVHLFPKIQPDETVATTCNKAFENLCENLANHSSDPIWDGCEKWCAGRRDYHPVRGLPDNLKGLKVPTILRGVIGIVTTGVHMNMYTKKKVNGENKIFVWVSKRSENVTYAGKLDQVVAGAMEPEDNNRAHNTLQREAKEEAGLVVAPDNTVSADGQVVGNVKYASTITFWDKKDKVAGSEAGHLEPGLRYTYDLEVDPDFTPVPTEPESITGFFLKSADEVKEDLKNEEWKPNCGLVMLDFLMRHGELKEGEDVESIQEIQEGLQRELPLRLDIETSLPPY